MFYAIKSWIKCLVELLVRRKSSMYCRRFLEVCSHLNLHLIEFNSVLIRERQCKCRIVFNCTNKNWMEHTTEIPQRTLKYHQYQIVNHIKWNKKRTTFTFECEKRTSYTCWLLYLHRYHRHPSRCHFLLQHHSPCLCCTRPNRRTYKQNSPFTRQADK